jgi:hypothetical protein
VPPRLISKVFQHASSSEEEMGERRAMNPALLIRMPSFPIASVIVMTAFEMEDESKTSRFSVSIDGGSRFTASVAVLSVSWMLEEKGSMERSAICKAPAVVNECAVARPTPPEAPIMKTV